MLDDEMHFPKRANLFERVFNRLNFVQPQKFELRQISVHGFGELVCRHNPVFRSSVRTIKFALGYFTPLTGLEHVRIKL